MALCFLAYQVADLCLGKPPLRSLSASASLADALAALKSSQDNFISVWTCCDHRSPPAAECCKCIGKLCMVDIICFLCKDDNLASPASAFESPVASVLLPKSTVPVRHVQPSSSLLDAINLILDEDAENLVVPIRSNSKKSNPISKSCHLGGGQEYCWLTQEDIIRFLLSSIALFSPISTLSIHTLGVISDKFPAVGYSAPASMAIAAISRSLVDQTSVAVVDDGGVLIGEISPFTLACCDETVAAAVATLSAGELMAYIDCGGPPDKIVRVVEERLKEQGLEGLMAVLTAIGQHGSNNDEVASLTTPLSRSGWYSRSSSYSARMVRRAEAIVCHPGSSMVAVMIQAIAHRVNYIWVIDEDCSVVGIVTFANMLEVFRKNLESMI